MVVGTRRLPSESTTTTSRAAVMVYSVSVMLAPFTEKDTESGTTNRCSGCALSAPAYWFATTCAAKVAGVSYPLNDPTVVRNCELGRIASRVTGRAPPGKNGSPLNVGGLSLHAAAGSRA